MCIRDRGNSVRNGQSTVFSTVTTSLVGAILTTNGETKATKFVDELLLKENSNPISLIDITNEHSFPEHTTAEGVRSTREE